MTISSKNCEKGPQMFQLIAHNPGRKRASSPAKAIEQYGIADPSVETLFWFVFVYQISALALLTCKGQY
jgi:hypothetical protein